MRFANSVFAALLAGCVPVITTPANEAFTLRVGQTASVENAALRITFVRVVSDSRCPSDVDCIWAGNGQIEIELRANGAVDTARLNTFDGAREASAGNYRIEFVALAPTPRSTGAIPQSQYRATFRAIPIGPVCTEEARPGLSVSLSDSLAPNFFAFTNVHVIAVDGAYRDSAFIAAYDPQYGQIPLAYERAATYTVIARADGRAQWSRSGIEVAEDVCHVITVPVPVRFATQQ
ncbi:MAG TPA: hypothetical protein VJR92_02435 [Gemmatimonadaceae bacterium]|nr:hypothetical protein [Gemmatimonadaceae bacterium]